MKDGPRWVITRIKAQPAVIPTIAKRNGAPAAFDDRATKRSTEPHFHLLVNLKGTRIDCGSEASINATQPSL
jgi:hypothetical protein